MAGISWGTRKKTTSLGTLVLGLALGTGCPPTQDTQTPVDTGDIPVDTSDTYVDTGDTGETPYQDSTAPNVSYEILLEGQPVTGDLVENVEYHIRAIASDEDSGVEEITFDPGDGQPTETSYIGKSDAEATFPFSYEDAHTTGLQARLVAIDSSEYQNTTELPIDLTILDGAPIIESSQVLVDKDYGTTDVDVTLEVSSLKEEYKTDLGLECDLTIINGITYDVHMTDDGSGVMTTTVELAPDTYTLEGECWDTDDDESERVTVAESLVINSIPPPTFNDSTTEYTLDEQVDGSSYAIDATATDPMGGEVSYELLTAPTVPYTFENGILTITDTDDEHVGTHTAQVKATNEYEGETAEAVQEYSITVENVNEAPSVSTGTDQEMFTQESLEDVVATVTDVDAGDSWTASITSIEGDLAGVLDSYSASVDSSGNVSLSLSAGSYDWDGHTTGQISGTVYLEVQDAAGLTATTTLNVDVYSQEEVTVDVSLPHNSEIIEGATVTLDCDLGDYVTGTTDSSGTATVYLNESDTCSVRVEGEHDDWDSLIPYLADHEAVDGVNNIVAQPFPQKTLEDAISVGNACGADVDNTYDLVREANGMNNGATTNTFTRWYANGPFGAPIKWWFDPEFEVGGIVYDMSTDFPDTYNSLLDAIRIGSGYVNDNAEEVDFLEEGSSSDYQIRLYYGSVTSSNCGSSGGGMVSSCEIELYDSVEDMPSTSAEELVNALQVNDICGVDGVTNGDNALSEYEDLALQIIHGSYHQDLMDRLDTSGL